MLNGIYSAFALGLCSCLILLFNFKYVKALLCESVNITRSIK